MHASLPATCLLWQPGKSHVEIRSSELPQIEGYLTAVKAEDASRIGAGELNSSRLYTHAGTGGTLQELITDFGHTRDLVANANLLAKAQEQTTIATEQDVLLATDQAFYRLLNAQSLLEVAQATVQARNSVQSSFPESSDYSARILCSSSGSPPASASRANGITRVRFS